jgi:hypothetical protein
MQLGFQAQACESRKTNNDPRQRKFRGPLFFMAPSVRSRIRKNSEGQTKLAEFARRLNFCKFSYNRISGTGSLFRAAAFECGATVFEQIQLDELLFRIIKRAMLDRPHDFREQ